VNAGVSVSSRSLASAADLLDALADRACSDSSRIPKRRTRSRQSRCGFNGGAGGSRTPGL